MFAKFQEFASDGAFNLEAGLSLANTFLAGTERLAALNLDAARMLMNLSADNVKSLLDAKNAQSLLTTRTTRTNPVFDNAIAYSRGVYQIAAETKDEVAKIIEVQFADAHAKVTEFVDDALKSAPAGSETAVAAMRLAFDNANTAYAKLNMVARQVAEIADSNLAAASDATFNAAANVAKTAKMAA